MADVKKGDKLFVVTRKDLFPGDQAVQGMHALRQFVAEHPGADEEWFTKSNYLAFVSVDNEIELEMLHHGAKKQNLCVSAFYEEDMNNALTAIAIEPHWTTDRLCKKLPLALTENPEKTHDD